MEETAFFREGVPIHGETFEMVAYGMTPPQEALLLLLKRGIHLVFTWYSHAVFKFTVELLPVPLKVFTCRSWIACIMQHVCSPQCVLWVNVNLVPHFSQYRQYPQYRDVRLGRRDSGRITFTIRFDYWIAASWIMATFTVFTCQIIRFPDLTGLGLPLPARCIPMLYPR